MRWKIKECRWTVDIVFHVWLWDEQVMVVCVYICNIYIYSWYSRHIYLQYVTSLFHTWNQKKPLFFVGWLQVSWKIICHSHPVVTFCPTVSWGWTIVLKWALRNLPMRVRSFRGFEVDELTMKFTGQKWKIWRKRWRYEQMETCNIYIYICLRIAWQSEGKVTENHRESTLPDPSASYITISCSGPMLVV